MNTVILQTAASTNSWAAANEKHLSSPSLIRAVEQSAGRGQRGNSWEAEPGKNLTLSFFFRPDPSFHPREQFSISEATALSVVATLDEFGIGAKIKWPNDIYVGERKICGILIEHALLGSSISRSIAGIGLNVNQREFVSDAPNPVSMAQLTGRDHDLDEVCASLAANWERELQFAFPAPAPDSVPSRSNDAGASPSDRHSRFMASLWRNDGCFHPFLQTADSERFEARIREVEYSGRILLELPSGEVRSYWFKEISWL